MYNDPSTLPPTKPLITPLRMVLIALLLLFLWGAYFLYTVMYAPVRITTNYGAKAHESVRARQNMPASAPDGWEPFTQLGEKFDSTRALVEARNPSIPLSAYDFTLLYRHDYDPNDSEFTREDAVRVSLEWLEEFRKAGGLDDLKQFPGLVYAARPPQDGAALGFLMPELGKTRLTARMNAARMYLAAQAGDDAERLAAFEQSLAMARLVSAQFAIIDHLVSVAIHALMQGEVRYQIVEGKVSGPAAADLLAAMDRQKLSPLGPVFDTERYFTLDTIQRTFSDYGNGNGRFMPTAAAAMGSEFGLVPGGQRMGEFRIFNLVGLLQPDRKSTEATANGMFDRFIKLSEMPRDQRKASGLMPDYDAELRGYKILELLMPAIGKAMQSRDQIKGDTQATRIMLALEMHRAQHGAYPDKLAALVPGILPELPMDAVTDLTYGYKLLDAATDEHGRGYLLYSFASDGIDNGGFMSDKPPITSFLTGGQKGLDFVFNMPRPKPKPPEPEVPAAPEEDHSNFQIETAPAPVKGGS